MDALQPNVFIVSDDPLGAVSEAQAKPKSPRRSHKPGPPKLIKESNKKHIPKQLVAEMLTDGYKQSYIANRLDISPQTVNSINNILVEKEKEIEAFSKHKSMMLNFRQLEANRLGNCINISLQKDLLDNELRPVDKINWLKALDIGFSVFFDKDRLLMGKSTSNVAVLSGFMRAALNEV